jgi:hypothetical protein
MDGWMDGYLHGIGIWFYWLERSSLNAQEPCWNLSRFSSVPRTDRIFPAHRQVPIAAICLSVQGSSVVVQLVLVSSHCNQTVISRLLDGNCTWTAQWGFAPVMTSGTSPLHTAPNANKQVSSWCRISTRWFSLLNDSRVVQMRRAIRPIRGRQSISWWA